MATLQAELNGILGWIEQLNEVNVDGVEPLTGAAQMALKMRDDVVTDGGYPEQVLANAPERAGQLLRRAEGRRMSAHRPDDRRGARRAARQGVHRASS